MKCKKCGQILDDGTKFCTNCGSPIEITIKKTPKPTKVPKPKKSEVFKLTTTNSIPGYRVVECYGTVNATIVILRKSIDFGLDKIGGSISALTDLFSGGGRGNYSPMAKTYEEVYEGLNKRIIEKAAECGCNAILGLRYQPQPNIIEDYIYLTAYGTACVIEKE